MVISWVLNSLNDTYSGFISTIIQALRKDPNAYTIDSLFSSLIDEARGKEEEDNSQNRLLTIGSKKAYKKLPYRQKYCENYINTSHMTKNCWFLFPNQAPSGWKPRSREFRGPKSKG